MEKKGNEQLLPIGNLKGGYEIVSSNFNGNDLVIKVVSTRDKTDEVPFVFFARRISIQKHIRMLPTFRCRC